MSHALLKFCVVGLAAGLSVAAASAQARPSAEPTVVPLPGQRTPPAPVPQPLGIGTQKWSPLSTQERQFITKAAGDCLATIELSRLASERALSPAVKSYAQKVQGDHQRAHEELRSIANEQGVVLPIELNADQKRSYDQLASLTGEAFDRSYLDHMSKGQERDLSAFQRQSKEGQNERLREFASSTLNTIRQHKSTLPPETERMMKR
jgi:putative membrane protein